MHLDRRAQRALCAGALSILLMLSVALGVLSGMHRTTTTATGDTTQVAAAAPVVAVVPQPVIPVPPEARQAVKPHPGMLLLVVATVAALVAGLPRRMSWFAAAGSGPVATPAVDLRGLRGRAPPRRMA